MTPEEFTLVLHSTAHKLIANIEIGELRKGVWNQVYGHQNSS